MAKRQRKERTRKPQSPQPPSLLNKQRDVERVKPTNQSTRLFVLPLELRFMIYEFLFLAEPTIVSARYKSTILCTNKAINTEAKPLLYQHHEFHFACGGWQSGSPCSIVSLGWMTKISLHNYRHFFPKYGTGLSVRAQLFVLKRYATRLRSLKIDFHLNRNEKLPELAFISGLWDRLSYIEARFTQRGSHIPSFKTCLMAIARSAEWREGEVRLLEGYDIELHGTAIKTVKDLPQRTYWLSRSKRRMEELGST